MHPRELKRRAALRSRHILQKIADAKDWNIENLIAYCQGRAFEVAVDNVETLENYRCRDTRDRMEVLKVALFFMIEELMECVKVLENPHA